MYAECAMHSADLHKYHKEIPMRHYEFIGERQSQLVIQPDLLKHQAAIASIVKDIADSDVHKPSKEDMVVAIMQYRNLKRQRNKQYARSLQRKAKRAVRYISQ